MTFQIAVYTEALLLEPEWYVRGWEFSERLNRIEGLPGASQETSEIAAALTVLRQPPKWLGSVYGLDSIR